MRFDRRSFVLWAIAENVLTLFAFTATVIFAPGGWKILAVLILLNLNCWPAPKEKNQKGKDSDE